MPVVGQEGKTVCALKGGGGLGHMISYADILCCSQIVAAYDILCCPQIVAAM